MTKSKTLDRLRTGKERTRDVACTGTAQSGAPGEPKKVSGERRTHQTRPPPKPGDRALTAEHIE